MDSLISAVVKYFNCSEQIAQSIIKAATLRNELDELKEMVDQPIKEIRYGL